MGAFKMAAFKMAALEMDIAIMNDDIGKFGKDSIQGTFKVKF